MPALLKRWLLILTFAIAVVFAAFAQTGNAQKSPAAKAPAAKAAPAASEKFDPHDLSAVWNMSFPQNAPEKEIEAYVSQFGKGDPPMTEWSKERFEKTKPSFGPRGVRVDDTNDPAFKCFPPGVPRIYLHPFPMQIVQTPKETIMLFEYDHTVRHIYTDGRPHPKDVTPTYMGDSIGHWEGDTFVVDTVGFNDKTWLDRIGHPHSDQLHVVERFKRTDAQKLEVDFTIEDPIAYTHPFTSTLFFRSRPTWNIMEQVCEDNEGFLGFEK
jgi:hypothetical protein